MAVSKKKSASKKKAGKQAAPSKAKKKKGSSPAKKSKGTKPVKSVPAKAKDEPKKSASKKGPGRDAAALESALAESRDQIALLIDDRETQMAIAEGADAERSMLQDELEEAQGKIRGLEQKLEEHSQSQAAAPPDDEEIVGYGEEEEEEEGEDAEDLDDVDSIYSRMNDPRVRRQELDRERIDLENEVGDEPYWRICPKCGGTLDEADAGEVKLDRCESCGGLFLDQGEVDMLLSVARGTEGLHRIRAILQL